MRKETARHFWRRYLGLVCNGSASIQVQNPALLFTVSIKSGEYDDISDEEYNKMLKDCNDLSAIWHKELSRGAGDIFFDALKMTKVNASAREKIADVLAECSTHSVYLPPEAPSASSQAGNGQPDIDVFHNTVEPDDWSPRTIYDYLCKRIQGQEEAKKAAAMITYNHALGRRSTALFCGPSGCGKSEIWRHLAKDYPKLIRIIDASRLCADGWKGSIHLRDIFEGISPSDIQARGLIVVLDEADKLCCEAALASGGANHNALIQNSLLKMLDGDIIEFGNEDNGKKAFQIDCSRVSVVLLGAFEHLLQDKSADTGGIGFDADSRMECNYSNTEISYEDLITAGMRREIAGRINRIVPLHPLSVSDYKVLLTGSIMDDLQAMGQYKIKIDDHSADVLSQQAVKKELGARWMRSQIMNALDDLMFDNPTADVYTVNYPAA